MKNIFEIINETNRMIGQGDFEHAAERFLEALKINPDFAWNALWVQTPWAFYTELLPTFKEDFDKIHIRSKITCINTMIELGQNKEALATFIPKLESILPGDPLPLEMYARAHAALGHFYCALRYVERIEAIMPDTSECFDEEYSGQVSPLQLFKLEALFELGDDDAFECLIGEMLSENPNQPDLYLHKSFWLRDRGKYREGLAASETALKLRRSSTAFFQHGWFRRALGDPNAVADFRAFLEMPVADSEQDYYLPFIYCYLGREKQARQSVMNYLAAYPDSYESYYLCAEIFSLLGDIPMAMESLEQAFSRGLVSRAGLYADPALQPVRKTVAGATLIRNHLRKLEDEDMKAAREMTHCF